MVKLTLVIPNCFPLWVEWDGPLSVSACFDFTCGRLRNATQSCSMSSFSATWNNILLCFNVIHPCACSLVIEKDIGQI